MWQVSLDSVDAYEGAPNPPNISVPRTHSIQSKILNYPIWHPVNLHKSWFRVSTPSGKVVIIFFTKCYTWLCLRLSISLMKLLYKASCFPPNILTKRKPKWVVKKLASYPSRPSKGHMASFFSGRPTGNRSHIHTERSQVHPPIAGLSLVFIHTSSSCQQELVHH